ncbi:QueT transporter family protein [Defluviitalea phaphyphila]|uniref:QueT transporter family protein n=1 Tax=Defluviitalea phaphyphila TaxID=1473580 RepID=UPI0007306A03|nr:QueT transporter family protein [Defluviitalea phaphyphila]
MNKKILFLVQSALIAAIYVVLTLPFAVISTDYLQVRISEALTVLPFYTPAAIPGLFIGCLLSNIFVSKFGMVDIVFGSLATLIAAFLSYKMPKKILVPIPPIIVNAVIVGFLIYYGTFGNIKVNTTLFVFMGGVGLGQLIACYGLGYPLMLIIDKYKNYIFK